jgi:hypothetical protein
MITLLVGKDTEATFFCCLMISSPKCWLKRTPKYAVSRRFLRSFHLEPGNDLGLPNLISFFIGDDLGRFMLSGFRWWSLPSAMVNGVYWLVAIFK